MLLCDLSSYLFTEIGEEEADTEELEQEQEQESEDYVNPEIEPLTERELNELYQAQDDLDYLLNDPVIAQRIAELNSGNGSDSRRTEPVEKSTAIDEAEAMKNPTQYLKQLVSEAVRGEVGSVVRTELESTLQPLLRDNYEKQAISEFGNVQKLFPTIKGVTFAATLNTLSRHPTLTMEDAYVLAARQKGTVVEGKGKPPILERPSKRSTSSTKEESLLKDKADNLRERAEAAEKQGMNIRAIAMKFLKGET